MKDATVPPPNEDLETVLFSDSGIQENTAFKGDTGR